MSSSSSRLVPLLAIVLAACDPAPEPGDVGIQNLELTQGIQNVLNQVPLLAGKATFVRVYVRGNTEGGAAVPAVTAALTIDGGAPIAPLGTTSVTAPAMGSDPRTLTDSFVFALPAAALTPGSHHVRVELILPTGASVSDPTKLVSELDLMLHDPVRLRVFGVRYGYTNVPLAYQQRLGLTSSTWPARPFSDFEDQRDGAEQMMPLSSLMIEPLPGVEPAMFDCRYTGDAASGGCAGYEDARPWAAGIIDAAFPGGGETIVVLQPETTPGGFLGGRIGSGAGNSVINMQPNTSEVGTTLGHELYHSLGVLHTAVGLDHPEVNYPRRTDGGLGPYVGVRSRPVLRLFPGDNLAGETTGYDLMSYRFPAWPSPYIYCRALSNASGGRVTCPPGVDGWDRTL